MRSWSRTRSSFWHCKQCVELIWIRTMHGSPIPWLCIGTFCLPLLVLFLFPGCAVRKRIYSQKGLFPTLAPVFPLLLRTAAQTGTFLELFLLDIFSSVQRVSVGAYATHATYFSLYCTFMFLLHIFTPCFPCSIPNSLVSSTGNNSPIRLTSEALSDNNNQLQGKGNNTAIDTSVYDTNNPGTL